MRNSTFRPRALRRALLLSLLLPAGSALADTVAGTCTNNGKSVTLTDAVVYREPNTFEETKEDVVIVFTNVALDKAKIAAATGDGKEDAVREQVWDADGGAKAELHINEQGEVWALHFSGDGGSMSTSGSAIGELKLATNDAKRVAGSFKLVGDDADDLGCDATFDLSYDSRAPAGAGKGAATAAAPAAPAPTGKPLPAGGGAAGKVFLANSEAMRKGDVEAMLATASKEQADQIRASRDDPEFKSMIEMMKAFAPQTVEVTGGQDFGDRAELTVKGKDAGGDAMNGTVKMVKEGADWKVEKASFKSGG